MEKSKLEIGIPLDVYTDVAKANISIVQGKEPIVAFVQLDFGFIKIKGITVKKRDFKGNGEEILIFDMPAYKAGYNYIKSAVISDKRIYFQISNAVLQKIKESTSMNYLADQEVSVDDIPF